MLGKITGGLAGSGQARYISSPSWGKSGCSAG